MATIHMSIALLSKANLLNAVRMTKRPVAFLVGAPLSLKAGVGVPGVDSMLDLVRDEVRECDAAVLPQLEAVLAGKIGADAYQEAMKWLGENTNQDTVNEIVAKAVLKARRPGSGDVPQGRDGRPDDWNIPSGTADLAELVVRGGDRFLGPILTTNFDPLISLAIRKSAGWARRSVLTADGMLPEAAESEPGVSSVVHLHGFWRDSETLHTPSQLTNPRPKLKASLRRLLVAQPRTLIVAAYGGWDDVFTASLIDLINDEPAKIDVIWCFYESRPDEVEQKYGKLLNAVRPAIVLNRFRLFGGIDCHSIFSEILFAVRGASSPAVVTPASSSPLAGWEQIDGAYLDSLPALNQEEVIRYFDGAVPMWRHAVSPAIPRRQHVTTIAGRLATFQPGNRGCSMQLIRAAGGEGKTTLLLQAAADAVRNGTWSVLWRHSPHARLLPEHISKLDPARQWLIVADDAENLVGDLQESARQLRAADRSNVHFLLAARDADWQAKLGDTPAWEMWIKAWVRQQQAIVLRGINPDDARLVVEAWAKCGSDGLRELAVCSDAATQVDVFMNKVQEAVGEQVTQERKHNPVDGSFFGGLLAVRFGQDGLQAHVRAFLDRLKNSPIEGSDSTLLDALLYVAACHGTGIPGIDERVLADLVGVPREWVKSRIVRPLGEEAAAVQSADHVFTRHSKVAAAILVEAEQSLGIDLAEIWAKLVHQTIRTGNDVVVGQFGPIIHAGPRLQRALSQQIPEDRRKAIAIAAAKVASTAVPDRMSLITDLGRTYRNAGMGKQAVATFRGNLKNTRGKKDFDSDIRGYWYEWSVCEGMSGRAIENTLANVWLGGLAISDHLKPVQITSDNGKLVCAGLGVAFGKLAKHRPDCPFAKGRRAAAYLGRRFGYDPKGEPYFNHYDRESDKIKTPHPRGVAEAIAWLTAGASQAGRELQDPFLKALLKTEQISFTLLQKHLGSSESLKDPSREGRPRLAQTVEKRDDINPLNLHSALDSRIKAGIERVLIEAWKTVSADGSEEQRFKAARGNAAKIISCLSPHIKRPVGAYFETQKWLPLKAYKL